MRGIFSFAILTAAVLAAPSIATAGDNAGFLQHQQDYLEARGYRDIQPMSATGARVTAVDAQGSEVIVHFDPDQGTIRSVIYVRASDR